MHGIDRRSSWTRVRSGPIGLLAVASLVALLWTSGHTASGGDDLKCKYDLEASNPQPGRAEVKIDGEKLEIKLKKASPDALYTVWVDFRNRATLALAADYPVDQGALARGVAPAFGLADGATNGMGFDPNTIVTNKNGDGKLKIELDYQLLESGDAPVVAAELLMQGENRVGGGWLRVYEIDPAAAPSPQVIDDESGLPLVRRATPQGFTIVRHPAAVTHGHTPGVGGIDHFPAFKGDLPSSCRP